MRLYIRVSDYEDFLKLKDGDEYLKSVLLHLYPTVYFIKTQDVSELKQILDSKFINYTIK